MRIELIHGDCETELDNLISSGVKVDMIITSPPYNLAHGKRKDGYHPKASRVKYNEYHDDLSADEYIEWQINIINKCHEILSNRGLIYYNHKQRHKDGRFFHPLFLFERSRFRILQNIIWKRAGGTNFNVGRFVNSHEDIVVGYKSDNHLAIDSDSEKLFDVWNIPQDKFKDHPATFPVALSNRILGAYKQKGISVLDPFMGSGTAGLSCLEFGFDFIGIELDKTYHELAVDRIKKHNAQLDLFREQAEIIVKA